jgi:valyl-tRNA synthetase
MPFITEELWALTADHRDTLLCHAEWPRPEFADTEAAGEVNWLIDLVTGIRSVRAETNVPASAMVPLVIVGAGEETRQRLLRHDPAIKQLARVEDILIESEVPKGSAQIIVGEATACLPLGGLIDVDAERARLTKAAGKVDADIKKLEGKLGNEKFIANAKPEVVEGEREKLAERVRGLHERQTIRQVQAPKPSHNGRTVARTAPLVSVCNGTFQRGDQPAAGRRCVLLERSCALQHFADAPGAGRQEGVLPRPTARRGNSAPSP